MTRNRIRKVSVKREAQLKEYREVVRPNFMLTHKECQVEDCNNAAVDVHHKRGRSGEQINKVEDFMAACRECHTYIEEHPAWAKAHDYSRSRLWTN